MKHDEHALRRLLKATSRSQAESPGTLPFATEARILAHWRSGEAEDDSELLASLFRRAVIWASVVMVLSIGWSQLNAAREVPGAATLAKLEHVIPVVP
jgi:hypothetical protein